jgi:hypothetical protein
MPLSQRRISGCRPEARIEGEKAGHMLRPTILRPGGIVDRLRLIVCQIRNLRWAIIHSLVAHFDGPASVDRRRHRERVGIWKACLE